MVHDNQEATYKPHWLDRHLLLTCCLLLFLLVLSIALFSHYLNHIPVHRASILYPAVRPTTTQEQRLNNDFHIPVGATAKCVDGTYSFSPHYKDICAYNGGVSNWL